MTTSHPTGPPRGRQLFLSILLTGVALLLLGLHLLLPVIGPIAAVAIIVALTIRPGRRSHGILGISGAQTIVVGMNTIMHRLGRAWTEGGRRIRLNFVSLATPPLGRAGAS